MNETEKKVWCPYWLQPQPNRQLDYRGHFCQSIEGSRRRMTDSVMDDVGDIEIVLGQIKCHDLRGGIN